MGDLPDCVLIAADAAMGAQHQIGSADSRPGEGVENALTHPVISINRKRQKHSAASCVRLGFHCDVFVGANNFLFSRCLASILPVFNYSSHAQRVDYGTYSA